MTKTTELLKPTKQTTTKEDRTAASLEHVANFVRRVIREDRYCTWLERRICSRYPIALPVTAKPLDHKYRPVGESFLAVTRDISANGLCLYHSQPITANYLELRMTSNTSEERIRVVLEVVRCQQAGPFFQIGGKFVEQARIGEGN